MKFSIPAFIFSLLLIPKIWTMELALSVHTPETKQSHDHHRALTITPADACDIKRSDAACRKAKLRDDTAFDATEFPAEIQALVKTYTLSPVRFFQALHKKQFIPVGSIDKFLMLSNILFATTPNAPVERNSIDIWDITTGACKHTLKHNGTISKICKTPGGLLVSASQDARTVRVWNPQTGKLIATIATPVQRLVALSDDILALVHNRTVTIWDVNKKRAQEKHELSGNTVEVFALPNQCLLIKDCMNHKDRFHLWSQETGLRALALPLESFFEHRSWRFMEEGNIVIFDRRETPFKFVEQTAITLYDPLQGKAMNVKRITRSPDMKSLVCNDHFACNATHCAFIRNSSQGYQITVEHQKTGKTTHYTDPRYNPHGKVSAIKFLNDLLAVAVGNCIYLYDPHDTATYTEVYNTHETLNNFQVEYTPDLKNIVIYHALCSHVHMYDASAYADLCTLSAEQLIMLEKLMQQFLSTYGLHNAPYEKSHVLAGEMLKNFKNLPKSIQNCLASQYNITAEDDLKDSGMQMACAIL